MQDAHTSAKLQKRPPEHTVFAFVVTTALFLIVSYLVLSPPTRLVRRLRRTITKPTATILAKVPIPGGLQTPADLVIAARSFSHYPTAQQRWLSRKWLAYERMPARQRRLGAKLDWPAKLTRAEEAIETNSVVTDELAALAFDQARKEGVPVGLRSRFWREDGRVVETLKHFVRDWSEAGKGERDVLFPPILDALRREFDEDTRERKVLLPGSGLARLAYEISLMGYQTEANDYSHFMNLGSSLIFKHTRIANQYELAPYIHSFSHHRSTENMLRTVSFPDVVPQASRNLVFSPGDFLELYRTPETHDAVVTLFFIDTASNLVSYLDTLYGLLKPGGIWINLGPLLYYGNPAMELPLEDVLRLAELVGFKVEEQREVKQARYTADEDGMYTFAYDCAFWIARKPV
ncbi:hypothetical protein JCM10908_006926 [Rhodotorula pacifica]|uniref:uncharacterized protein n=1 Tax=Rhodotorula pacifica TaxID=1495444 RepID=UPI00316FA7A1